MGKALEYLPSNQQSLVVKSSPSPFPSPGQKFPITSSCLCAGLRVGLYMRSRCWLLGMKAQLKLVCMKVIERSEGKGGSSIGRFLTPSCKRLHEVPPEPGWGGFKFFWVESLQNNHLSVACVHCLFGQSFDVSCYTGSGFLFVLLNSAKGKKGGLNPQSRSFSGSEFWGERRVVR